MSHRLRAAIASIVLIAPFAILEWKNQADSLLDFPYSLFVILWAVPFVFFLSLPGVLRPAASNGIAKTALKAVCLVAIAVFWVGLVIDQMPCFLGVPNCD